MEEAKRQDHTILVYCLPLKAKQKDIWNFFFKSGCGKIRGVRVIKDERSGKSKGVAYVEFYTSESVEKALTLSERPFQLNGREFTGLRVQHSQAEKNRAAAAKQMRVIKPIDALQQAQDIIRKQMKVLVGGLVDKLSQIQQSELKELFQPFGEIAYIDIIRDSMTGRCKGYAFIQYTITEDAKAAVKDMNGLAVGGKKITVQTGTTSLFFEDLKKQVMTACTAHGIVEKCFIEKNNQGNVWVKFSDTQSAIKAQESLNGKFFDDKKVFCYFVIEQTYQRQ